MKENKNILKKTIYSDAQYNSPIEEFQEMAKEDRELYLFLLGGFAAK